MKDLSLLLALFLVHIIAFSQVEIGNRIDINGLPFNGYLDNIIYSPAQKLEFTHYSDSYEIGHYTDDNGILHNGLIKFENDKIWFKPNENSSRKKIYAEEIENLVIGVDSFFRISNFYFRDKLREKPDLVQYLTKVDGTTFVKKYHFTSAMAQGYGAADPIIESYLFKTDEDQVWKEIPKDREYNDGAVFEALFTGKMTYKEKDVFNHIKQVDYLDKYEKKKPIFYDQYWQEVRTQDDATYKANITKKVGNIWTLDYYKDSTKLYTGQYSSFYPHKKTGKFICYYSNGTIRKTITYNNNKAKSVKSFNANGELQDSYAIQYESYQTLSGHTKETTKPSFKQTHVSENDIYKNEYLNNELLKSYRFQKEDTVFQLSSKDIRVRLKTMQMMLNSIKEKVDYHNAISENAQGIVLITLRVDPKGYVINKEVLNSIHPDFDNVVNSFLFQTFLKSDSKLQLKPYKRNKKKCFYEITIPIVFNTVRFYRKPVSYNDHMHMHWQMQQMQMNNMNNFKPAF